MFMERPGPALLPGSVGLKVEDFPTLNFTLKTEAKVLYDVPVFLAE